MNDEIKEKIKSYYVANDIDEILDYITNLEQDYDNEAEENLKLSEWLVEKQQRIEDLEQENERLKEQIIIMEKYLELIYDLGFDYDGCGTIEGLKKLIDDLVHCASLGRACSTTEPIYTNMGKHYNILHEEIEGKE